MSKRHQASRRRTYARRQHELHQRPDLRDLDASPLEAGDGPWLEAGIGVLPLRGGRETAARGVAAIELAALGFGD